MAHQDTISGLVGKFVIELEISCNADKFYEMFRHRYEELPIALPNIFTFVKVVEGHGTTSGCVKEWGYLLEGKLLTLKEKTTYNDEARTIRHSTIEGDVLYDYKKWDGIVVVKSKAIGHGSVVSLIADYEKMNEDSPVPFAYVALFYQIIIDLNSYLVASA